MLPLIKQGRDSFTVREVKQGESCKLWDVVLYKRGTDQYVLHRRYMMIPMISLVISALG